MTAPIIDWKERFLLAAATCAMAGILWAAGAIFGVGLP
jgi:hypothetical protein